MTGRDNFNTVLKQVLKVSKEEIQRRIEADKQTKKIPKLAGSKT